ncbi:MAG: hypothetical protein ONB48_20815 [candidate division KSB1 bacterium]|nr:hypothetical protein [candidate division KSB1 bacterium]MDZ7276421.1 hypothetical protein [candidate division KSB1 bacterium]MDZ7288091.1 hypothetical protein [candidate division KSB1 bacterium]MDZ7300192.1 hypothetical protein [candidate division KSB1 bacterium]MDZ7305763.1 hypothetical protein [candidate division KSB1 bacterium]
MRIGEIVVIGANANEKQRFLAALSDELALTTPDFSFGRLTINNQLLLHLYGITLHPEAGPLAWDLLGAKILGGIVLFSWQDLASFELVKPVIDQLTTHFRTAVVVAAHLDKESMPDSELFRNGGITLTPDGRFTFCDVDDSESARRVLLSLIDLLIERSD